MGNHQVDMAEVEDFSTNLQEASEDIRSQLDQVKESIESINSMSSFSGKTAEEAKKYFEEMHLTIIESFRGLFDDLEGNLNKHIQDFQSDVDASETAKIESNYLKDVQEDIKEVFEDLKSQDESIAETIKAVSDITSAKPAEFSDVDKWKRNAVKKAKEVDEDLDTFTGIGDEHDVEAVLSQIESVMEQAQTSKGSARFSDFKGASNMKDLEKLQEYNKISKENNKIREDEKLEEIASYMYGVSYKGNGVKENEQLKQHINEDVLVSEEALNNEIKKVTEYLQQEDSSNGGYIEFDSEHNDHVKLNSYLHILNNYKKSINEVKDELDWDHSEGAPLQARVQSFESGFPDSEEEESFNFYANSDININYFQGEDAVMDRNEFLNRTWPEDKDLVYHNTSEVEFFRGENAAKQLGYKHQLEDKEIVEATNGRAFMQAIASSIMNTPTGAAISVTGEMDKKDKAKERIAFKDIEDASEDFELDIMVNHRKPMGRKKTKDMELYPSKRSEKIIKRWKEHEDFPTSELYTNEVEEMLDNRDWTGLIQFVKENEAEFNPKEKGEIYRYIKGKETDIN